MTDPGNNINAGEETLAQQRFDVAIIGGGLAGLCAAILLAKQQHKVILFEKETYPFHRVCGEYISMESFGFLQSLGADPQELGASMITDLLLTGTNGQSWKRKLPLGGFGISRYLLDHRLATIARNSGVLLLEQTKVSNVEYSDDHFLIDTSQGMFTARAACGSFGKRSNLDIKWQRPFSRPSTSKLNNYIGIKYHLQIAQFPHDLIALHTFPGGYAGIVKIEEDLYNLCYLTTAANLKNAGGNVLSLEEDTLSVNPELRKIFQLASSKRQPVTISQVSFAKKSQVEEHILLIGDAAGMITPLCGNGMSMAMHGAKLAAQAVTSFLAGNLSRSEMEKKYTTEWNKLFAGRLKTGRIIQRLFHQPLLLRIVLGALRWFPGIGTSLIRKTHGKPF